MSKRQKDNDLNDLNDLNKKKKDEFKDENDELQDEFEDGSENELEDESEDEFEDEEEFDEDDDFDEETLDEFDDIPADSIDKKTNPDGKKHSGYVALIGRTNVGKSTFLNSIMEAKISIVSNKPQTTRKQILGIKTTPRGQIVFFDCPGVHVPHYRLNEKMMKDVHSSLMDCDILLYFIDIVDRQKDEFIMSMIKGMNKPVFLVINKIDKFSKSKILEMIQLYKDDYPWSEIVPISALKADNTDCLEDLIYKYLPENDGFYPEEETTLQTEKFYISELIREKLLQLVEEELPFTTTVQVEEITKRSTGAVYIRAEIYVESNSQKKIVVGKHGDAVKSIGQLARTDIEDYYDKKVFLDLFIKVVPDWRNSPRILSELDV